MHVMSGVAAVFLLDLHVFDARALQWTELTGSVGGAGPSCGAWVGMASTGGDVYVFGGRGAAGKRGRDCPQMRSILLGGNETELERVWSRVSVAHSVV